MDARGEGEKFRDLLPEETCAASDGSRLQELIPECGDYADHLFQCGPDTRGGAEEIALNRGRFCAEAARTMFYALLTAQ
jgi:hypothetical protein